MVREVFKKRVGNYLVGRTVGEVWRMHKPAIPPLSEAGPDKSVVRTCRARTPKSSMASIAKHKNQSLSR